MIYACNEPCVFDIETNGHLEDMIDFSKGFPLALTKEALLHMVNFRNCPDGRECYSVTSWTMGFMQELRLKFAWQLQNFKSLVGHNILGFDLPALKLFGVIDDYGVSYNADDLDWVKVNGELYHTRIIDTLILSKFINPDRQGGHSLESWGVRVGMPKIHYKQFEKLEPEMITYCERDTLVNLLAYEEMKVELQALAAKGFNTTTSLHCEMKIADLTARRQALFGFHYDKEGAKKALEFFDSELDRLSKEIDKTVPPAELSAAALKEFTPPAKQFKADGSLSVHMENFLAKHGIDRASINLPMSGPIKQFKDRATDDIGHIKAFLVSQGWNPTEMGRRDLSVNSNKVRRTAEEFSKALSRYIDETEASAFKHIRLRELDQPSTSSFRVQALKDFAKGKPVWVYTSPKISVGADKQICPALEFMGGVATMIRDFYTTKHRRSSIAGGGWTEDQEDGELEKGFLSAVRADGRISTWADTLGAPTRRYKHRVVCNIPRVTSLHGNIMRSQFQAGGDLIQLGFDCSSLEARVQANDSFKYEGGPELSKLLMAAKPNSLHCVNAKKFGVPRDVAKSIGYALIYGASWQKIRDMLGRTDKEAQDIVESFWESVLPTKLLKEQLTKEWEATGKKYIKACDGSHLVVRKPHAILNVRFQSSGALAMKRIMLETCRGLEAKGLLGDPFTDSLNDVKAWLMINMHDEQQFALHKSLTRFKKVNEGEYKPEDYAAQQHCFVKTEKGTFVGIAQEVTDAISKGFRYAEKELNFQLPLDFEFMLGKTWADCH